MFVFQSCVNNHLYSCMFLLVASFYQFKRATTSRKDYFETNVFFQIKNIYCEFFIIKYNK